MDVLNRTTLAKGGVDQMSGGSSFTLNDSCFY
jgi:hypothetical protein